MDSHTHKRKIRCGEFESMIGDFKNEDISLKLEGMFSVDGKKATDNCNRISELIGQSKESIYNKIAIKLKIKEGFDINQVEKDMNKFVQLQISNHKKSLFQLLKVDMKVFRIKNKDPSSIDTLYLIAEYMDDIHLIISDIRRVFFSGTEEPQQSNDNPSNQTSIVDFCFAFNSKFEQFKRVEGSALHFLLSAALFKFKVQSESEQICSQIFQVFGLAELYEFKLLFSKMKDFKVQLNFCSFSNIPYKKEFLNWLFTPEKIRYNQEEIEILKKITQEIEHDVSILSVFSESQVVLDMNVNMIGLFRSIHKMWP